MTIACAAASLSPATPARASAEPTAPVGTIHTIELPGGVEGIRRAIGDRRTTPPATVGIDIARRFHNSTAIATRDDPTFARLRAWLRTCAHDAGCGGTALVPDRVPLPGDPAFWRAAAFGGRGLGPSLLPAILDRRDTAFLYAALLSMREDLRVWMVARPALVRSLLPNDAGPLVVAAPHLRIVDGRWALPGGEAAGPVWTALTGVEPAHTEAFLPALLRAHGGLVAYLLEVMVTLSPEQQRTAFALASPDDSRRAAAGLELLDGVRAAARGWPIHERPFTRPSHDPAFLLAQIPVAADGQLALPGGRAFWSLVFGDGPFALRDEGVLAAWRDPARVSPGWLVDRVWAPAAPEQAIRYEQVLFAARRLAAADVSHAVSVAATLRGYRRYPQLLRVLDRLEVGDAARLAALVRRADALAQAGEDWRGAAAVVRWQALLVILDHMSRFGSLDAGERDRALDALAKDADTQSPRGSRVRAQVAALGVGPIDGNGRGRSVEQALVSRVAATRLEMNRRVAWEGQAYRLDLGAAERDRLTRVRGRDALPRLDAAWAAFALAEAAGTSAADALPGLAAIVADTRLARPAALDAALDRAARGAAATARRLVESGGAGRVSPAARAALDDLGEALATEALGEIAYALSMGWAEDLPLTALAAFRRHVFSEQPPAGTLDAFWEAPSVVAARGEPWHIAGSLLGLDDALGPITLRRPSLRPLGAAPSLNTGDRRWLVSTVAGLDRRPFTDAVQARLVAAAARGQARLAAIRTAADAREAGERAGASPLRQTLAGWLAAVNPRELGGVFSMTEMLRLGSYPDALPDGLVGWGSVQTPVWGRLAPGPVPSLPWERYTGRTARLVPCALPDLQLTLAVRIAAMDLPAALVPDLLPSATFELVNTATPRHADDFDALAERVRLIDATAVERYLGLLTVGGPLRAEPAGRTP